MKKVYFIGSGYEVVKMIWVKAQTNGDAFKKAEEWYKTENQTFAYMGLEIGR